MYQCHFMSSVLEQFPPKDTFHYKPQVGSKLTLGCTNPKSFPPPTIYWAVQSDTSGLVPVDLTDRIAIDPEGKNPQLCPVLG